MLLGIIVFSAFIKKLAVQSELCAHEFPVRYLHRRSEELHRQPDHVRAHGGAGTAFVFVYTYFIEKGRRMKTLKAAGRMLSLLPMALPGL
jgi:hypothetical protein